MANNVNGNVNMNLNTVAVGATIVGVVLVALLLSEGNWLGPVVALAAALLAVFAAQRTR
ncbi:hypothetical protein [Corynebacterium timonense]|uniref:Uncharacterized protein n=1 Tax=Corynebacterium timonense TaxID=441500 RepID=A0A1H1TW42_9CORY|nr:hypothetical protein [Corynebacterium timonense]SDS64457.1 hypothetical protein SAMN04488539_2088 [Corynebacterium timonense]